MVVLVERFLPKSSRCIKRNIKVQLLASFRFGDRLRPKDTKVKTLGPPKQIFPLKFKKQIE